MLPIGRLLVAGLCFCALPVLAQEHSIKPIAPGTIPTTQMPDFRTTPPSSEPWKIFPMNPGDRMNLADTPEAALTANGAPDGNLCYSIRSYVVARDRKDSDSVHPVGYSTCVPAKRYGLKKTVIQQQSNDR